ncbi:twin-arginine translocase TatA/TatE family subunit [bacterium]|nr:twin-arginine translocase TatA/TatE family subunit [bacterium]MBU1653116.1 twin-arginine translocase TatA/TatE family subunit [bacterium]
MMPSGSEILVILFVVLLLFGGKQLPKIARNIGKGIHELQKATKDIKREIDLDAIDPNEKNNKKGSDNLKG